MSIVNAFRAIAVPVILAITGTLFVASYFLYRWLLPKPIPGIPYNPEATKSIFGDIPSMLTHIKNTKTVSDWIVSHSYRHNSPIVQIWPSLFQGQWVLINDYRETQDILMRRTKEFDKPDLLGDILWGQAPNHHAILKTNDEWRGRRKLLQDLMTPAFLHNVAAPQLHANFMDLIQLWKEKTRLSHGRPFPVKHDIFDTALEAIWATAFGIEDTDTITRNQIGLLSRLDSVVLPTVVDEEVVFARSPAPPAFEAILRLTEGFEATIKSPFPYVSGFLQRYYPPFRKHIKVKNQNIVQQISRAEKRMVRDKEEVGHITNGVDHMLRREAIAAEKQGRAPEYHSRVMIDELFGLLIAGHDTTSTTLNWGMKFLTASQSTQTKLRSELHSTFPAAKLEGRVPHAHEIATTHNDYLDACIEEIVRCSTTSTTPSRSTTRDVVVLGHVIPKGTRVVFASNGGGVLVPAFPIADNLRNETYHKASGGKTGEWDVRGLTEFRPERWLVRDKDTGLDVFDAQAGPQLQFGAGLRGCYGRKLAYLEMRLAIVLIIWTFELMQVPERYSSWEAMEQLTRCPVQVYLKLKET